MKPIKAMRKDGQKSDRADEFAKQLKELNLAHKEEYEKLKQKQRSLQHEYAK